MIVMGLFCWGNFSSLWVFRGASNKNPLLLITYFLLYFIIFTIFEYRKREKK